MRTEQNKTPEQSPERLRILEKIRQLESEGGESFYVDVEDDPSGHELTPDDVDYLRKNPWNRVKTWIARAIAAVLQPLVRRDLQITVEGEENLRGICGGAIITSNHFSIFENLAVKEVADRVPGRHRFYRVIKGLNFYQPGWVGFLMKNCDTLPLSKNIKTMRLFGESLEVLLRRDALVLVYPEQAMWWNYRKPRPPKAGAYHYAAKCNVPIIPCFVTMEDMDRLDGYGFPKQKYTIHVMPPLYPDPEKPARANERAMQAENYRLCCEKYTEVYGEEP
ncbi:MAG: 1-acyl-sn-glycerol-3-phosphate acyltransferase [Ruminococcaceae bacterium]|nr:1-acyl-sn-glycerol-3-phosphate acyltransferase [Oscillospiraceae bacterium]